MEVLDFYFLGTDCLLYTYYFRYFPSTPFPDSLGFVQVTTLVSVVDVLIWSVRWYQPSAGTPSYAHLYKIGNYLVEVGIVSSIIYW